ncbi:hypothetical protein BH23PAT2_BH23PAT2_02350 [soil metagenome]
MEQSFTPQPSDSAANNAADIRESLGLPVDATREQVDHTIAANNATDIRESLGLPVDATREQVDHTIAVNNAAGIRESLGNTAVN